MNLFQGSIVTSKTSALFRIIRFPGQTYFPCFALLIAVFVVDLSIPRGVAVGVAHVGAVLWSLRWQNPRQTLWVAIAATVLTIAGYFVSEVGAAPWKVVFNRLLSLAAIWGVASVGMAVIRHETSLRRRTAELEEITEELDEFVYMASHDLRTPLRGIQNLATWIAEDDAPRLTGDSVDRLEKLRDRSSRLELLLEGVSNYARTRRFDEPWQSMDLDEILRNAVRRVPAGSCEFVLPPELPTIQGYPNALTEVFYQLLDNAARHHDRVQGKATVTFQENPETWQFEISDDGPGVEPMFAKKIFGMFETLKPKEKSKRAGVGLAFVRKLLGKMGGTIELNATEGRGASFRVLIPKNPDRHRHSEV